MFFSFGIVNAESFIYLLTIDPSLLFTFCYCLSLNLRNCSFYLHYSSNILIVFLIYLQLYTFYFPATLKWFNYPILLCFVLVNIFNLTIANLITLQFSFIINIQSVSFFFSINQSFNPLS